MRLRDFRVIWWCLVVLSDDICNSAPVGSGALAGDWRDGLRHTRPWRVGQSPVPLLFERPGISAAGPEPELSLLDMRLLIIRLNVRVQAPPSHVLLGIRTHQT